MSNHEETDLWTQVVSHDALMAAWYKVKANGGSPGGDGVGINGFQADLYANLTQLRSELLGGTYRSSPFRKVSIPKKKPGYRILTIPSIRDRILHTSISAALTPILEPMFKDGSFAYRQGRGVVHAVKRIETWRNKGYDVVIEEDIVSYFDNIDQVLLSEKITAVLKDRLGAPPLLALMSTIFRDQAHALGTPGQGLIQGSPLSPLLANLHLDVLDEEIEAQGVKIVRYADDFVILCKSVKKAEKVLEHCVRVLAEQNLHLHADGTRIVSFDKGFDFIGYLFLRTLALKEKSDPKSPNGKSIKSEVTDEGIIELEDMGSRFDPGRRVLYVLDPNHQLKTRNRSFSVLREDGSELIAIPHHRVGRIEIGPAVQFNRKPIDLALATDTQIAHIDWLGQTKGMTTANGRKSASVQLAQAKIILDTSNRIIIARKLVNARIRNQRTQLMRLNRYRENCDVLTALGKMKAFLQKVPSASTIEEVRGLEGATTAVYWPVLAKLLSLPLDKPFRRSRPAKDSINASINYLTGILERDIRAAVQSAGLHPGFGFLHASKDRHDGLIYDLMEPFRAPLTEGLVIFLFNAKRLTHEMFQTQSPNIIEMNANARNAVILGYESAVAKRVNRTDGKGKLSWRAMMRHQAQELSNAIRMGRPDVFMPYLMEP